MRIAEFQRRFEQAFPRKTLDRPNLFHALPGLRHALDPVRGVPGMTSLKKQRLLRLAFSCIGPGECYLEVGTFLGKSLISAARGNGNPPIYACDNFSEFGHYNSPEALRSNLERYGLAESVTFFDADFREVLNRPNIKEPVGLYFYDGAHDAESQYDGIVQAEPLLSDEALVVVDDWRYAEDSQSFAKAGTRRAIGDSTNVWTLLYELPARWNGDLAMWWNGVAVISFSRSTS